jgi:C-terminal processing protease CtpA/Prc
MHNQPILSSVTLKTLRLAGPFLFCFWATSAQAQVRSSVETAAQDSSFRHGSGMVTIHLTAQQVRNLTVLGKVWGFAKYYHPAVAQGKFNLDAELLRLLPKVLAAPGQAACSQLLGEWLTSLGPVPLCPTCSSLSSTGSVRQQPPLDWLTDKKVVGPELSRQLVELHQNRNQGPSYYVAPRSAEDSIPKFVHEEVYSQPYPEEELRLLALFRLWNNIQYFYPYKYLLDKPWDEVLPTYIPRFLAASDGLAYRLTVQELTCRLADAHCQITPDTILTRYYGRYRVPVRVQFVGRQAVVGDVTPLPFVAPTPLQRGDLITHIDDVPLATILEQRSRLTPRPNEPTQLREIARRLLWGNTSQVRLRVQRAGQSLAITVPRSLNSTLLRAQTMQPVDSSFGRVRSTIGYVHLGRIKAAQLPQLRQSLGRTKGIIIDMRAYPSDQVFFELIALFQDQPRPFAADIAPDLTYPGRFKALPKVIAPPGGEPPYTGRLLLLVNEETQSTAEFLAMALRTTPRALIVGSTTAGTDGDIAEVVLPGNVRLRMTTVGVYYADGRETQQVGIVPDVVVKPTIVGIREGRDEVSCPEIG